MGVCSLNMNGVDIDFNGKISGIIYNPVFWESINRSNPFEIPLTKKNKLAISFSHLIESTKDNNIYYDTIITTPYFVRYGKSQYLSYSSNSARFVFFENYTIYSLIKEKTLNQIAIDWWQPLNNTRLKHEYDDIVFAPIKNESAGENFPYDIALGNPNNMVNFILPDIYINGDDLIHEWWSGNNNRKNVFQPCYKTHAFVRKIFEYFGYTVTVNHLKTYKHLEKACLYSNFLPYYYELASTYELGTTPASCTFATVEGSMAILVEPPAPFTIPAVGKIIRLKKNASDTTAPTGTITAHVEYNGKTYLRVSITTDELGYNYHNLYKYIETVYAHIKPYDVPYQKTWPDWTIEKVLVEIQKAYGIYYVINDVSKTVEIHAFKKLFNNTNVEDITGKTAKVSDVTQDEYDGFELKYIVDDSDEEMSANFNDIGDNLRGETVDTLASLPAIAERNEVRFVQDEEKYYQFTTHINPFYAGWHEYSNFISYKTGGDNPYIHEIAIAPIAQATGQIGAYSGVIRVKFGVINQALNVNFIEPSSSPLRSFFYFGYQEPLLGTEDFPLTSVDNIDHKGNELTGYKVDLRQIYGAKSIYKYYLKEYIEWIVYRRKDCKFRIDWPKQMLFNIPFFKTFRIKNVNYIIKSIDYEIDFGLNTVKFPSTTLLKI